MNKFEYSRNNQIILHQDHWSGGFIQSLLNALYLVKLMSGKLEEKRIFLVATMDEVRKDMFSSVIQKHISNSTVFFAADGAEALFKIENAPPDVFITDYALPKMTGIDVVQQIVSKAKFDDVSIIICARLPDKEHFVDEVVTGKVQFFLEPGGEPRLAHCLTRALNRLTKDDISDYRLVFLAPDEVLIQEGEIGKSVFIVKKGTLQAYKSKKGLRSHFG